MELPASRPVVKIFCIIWELPHSRSTLWWLTSLWWRSPAKPPLIVRAYLLGCGITTGYGAETVTADTEEGSNVAIFGAGCIGLSVIEGAVKNKANKIIVVDVNDDKETWARKFGATDFVNPTKLDGKTVPEQLIELTDGGCDYTFDCTGNVGVMRAALESCHKGWCQSIIIGVAAAGQEISTRRKFTYLTSDFLTMRGAYQIHGIPTSDGACVERLCVWWNQESISTSGSCRRLRGRLLES